MYRRVVLTIVDGLRPDAVTPSSMPSLFTASRQYSSFVNTLTVRPSATVAALTSLATGVSPDTHRLLEPGLGFLSQLGRVRPMLKVLSASGRDSRIFSSQLPFGAAQVARAMCAAAGVGKTELTGQTPEETAAEAARGLDSIESGLIVVYLPHCDRAGHEFGWMSDEYLEMAGRADRGVAKLLEAIDDELLIVLADHGGGGVTPRDHDEPHELNDRIPLIFAGRGVRRRNRIDAPAKLLDVPPTVLGCLGVEAPAQYEGSMLSDAFVGMEVAA